ncbi:MAG: hypothetical protein WD800_06425 [Dehalococcoidia bacterium]
MSLARLVAAGLAFLLAIPPVVFGLGLLRPGRGYEDFMGITMPMLVGAAVLLGGLCAVAIGALILRPGAGPRWMYHALGFVALHAVIVALVGLPIFW